MFDCLCLRVGALEVQTLSTHVRMGSTVYTCEPKFHMEHVVTKHDAYWLWPVPVHVSNGELYRLHVLCTAHGCRKYTKCTMGKKLFSLGIILHF